MDKMEYKSTITEMKELIANKKIGEALEMADSINWRKVHNINDLLAGSEAYEAAGKMEEARDLLLLAHERSPIGRMIIYRLAMLFVKQKDLESAQEYYNEFVKIAPHDSLKYILKYKINIAKGADNNTLIQILEQLKEQDFLEEWAYELACLYHETGMIDKCIDLCDEIVLWFGEGPIVESALELKMIYQPLDKFQEDKYRHFQQKKDGITEITANEPLLSGEIIPHTITVPSVELPPERFDTVNLQAEIKKSIDEIMKATEAGKVVENMDAIKNLVEEIPYLQVQEEPLPEPEKVVPEKSINDRFEEYLSEEYDGQISLFIPENEGVADDDQIEGQMTIDDVLAEWEKTKRAAEAALEEQKTIELQNVKAKALKEAKNVLDRLEEAMPKFDAGMTSVDLLKEEYLAPRASFSIPKIDANGQTSGVMEIPVVKMEEATENTGVNHAQGIVSEEELRESETDSWAPPVLEQKEEDEDVNLKEASELIAGVNDILQQEIDRMSGVEVQEETEIEEPAIEESVGEDQSVDEEDDFVLPTIELPEDLLVSVSAEPVVEAIELEDEKLPEIDTSLPVIQDVELAPEEIVEMVDTKVLAKAIENEIPTIEFDEEDLQTFSYFLPINGMKSNISQVVAGAAAQLERGKKTGGNIVIQGEKGCGKTQMATSIIKVLQKKTGKISGGVGRVSGEKLNEKDIRTLFSKIQGGCLIIESAGQITKETALTLSLMMEHDETGTLLIMEDTKKGIEKALSKDASFTQRFTEKIVIPVFTIDELVEFGKIYALEAGYVIDEMGVLALYNRINLTSRFDHATSISEVADILEDAMDKSASGGLFRRAKVDSDGNIILKEKDFE